MPPTKPADPNAHDPFDPFGDPNEFPAWNQEPPTPIPQSIPPEGPYNPGEPPSGGHTSDDTPGWGPWDTHVPGTGTGGGNIKN